MGRAIYIYTTEEVSVVDLGLEEGILMGALVHPQISKTMPTSGLNSAYFCASGHLNYNVNIKVQCVDHYIAVTPVIGKREI